MIHDTNNTDTDLFHDFYLNQFCDPLFLMRKKKSRILGSKFLFDVVNLIPNHFCDLHDLEIS